MRVAANSCPKTAVAVLTKGYSNLASYTQLVARNKCIARSIASDQALAGTRFSVDYLIFHQGDITSFQRLAISIAFLPRFLKFKDIRDFFDISSCPIPSKPLWCCETDLSRMFTWGYKRMCSFWFNGFLRYTEGYDCVVRVDEDCLVVNLPLSSILDDLSNKRYLFATGEVVHEDDDPDVTVGLKPFSFAFWSNNTHLSRPVFNHNPYTNVFVVDRGSINNSLDFRAFSACVDASCCIHINRWGDLPLWGIALSMCLGESALEVRSDIAYYHGSHSKSVNSSAASYTPSACGSPPRRWLLILSLSKIINRFFSLPRRLSRAVRQWCF